MLRINNCLVLKEELHNISLEAHPETLSSLSKINENLSVIPGLGYGTRRQIVLYYSWC